MEKREEEWEVPEESKDLTGKPAETAKVAHRNLQNLSQQPEILQGSKLGPLHICGSCVVWSTCGTPNNRSLAIPNALSCSGEHITHTEWSCPAFLYGGVLSFNATSHSISC